MSTDIKYKKGELVRYRGKKAKVLNSWWDKVSSYRYTIKFVVGKNLVGDTWSVPEKSLQKYITKKERNNNVKYNELLS